MKTNGRAPLIFGGFLLMLVLLWASTGLLFVSTKAESIAQSIAGPNLANSCTTYTYTGPAITIPDDNSTGITSTLIIPPSTDKITSMQLRIGIEHSYPADLGAYLTTANLCESEIFDGNLDSQLFAGSLYFANDGYKYVDYTDYPYPLIYKPNADFPSNFRAGGRWTLHMVDFAGGDEGALTNWDVTLCAGGGQPPLGSATPTPTETATPTSTPTVSPTWTPVPTNECLRFFKDIRTTPEVNLIRGFSCTNIMLTPGVVPIDYEDEGFLPSYGLEGSDADFVLTGDVPRFAACPAYDLTYINVFGRSNRNNGEVSATISRYSTTQFVTGDTCTATMASDTTGTLADTCTGPLCYNSTSYDYLASGTLDDLTCVKDKWVPFGGQAQGSINVAATFWGKRYCSLFQCNETYPNGYKPGYSAGSVELTINGCVNYTPTPVPTAVPQATQTPRPPICGTPRPGGGWIIF